MTSGLLSFLGPPYSFYLTVKVATGGALSGFGFIPAPVGITGGLDSIDCYGDAIGGSIPSRLGLLPRAIPMGLVTGATAYCDGW